ncbi:MAG: GerMN domain-containing protein [Clostridia bacterium]|nr:GerMN domain-containing protein [Clostridia bacterium]
MDKNKLRIIVGILIILIVVGGFFAIRMAKNSSQETSIGEEYTPQEEITEEQERMASVNIYFPNKEKNKLEIETKLVDIREMMNIPYEKIFNLLKAGPKKDNLEKIIPKNTKVLKAYLDKDCLVLDLSKDFLNYDMEKENAKNNLINSIVYSLTELNEVNSVKFLIEGKEDEQFNQIYTRE